MTVNLQWHDAMTQAERKFTLAERGYGWPQTMEPIQLAELQRPCTHNNQMGRRAIKGLCRALVDACKAKSIDHRTTSKLVQGPYTHNGLIGFTLPGEVKELTIPHITAPAFAAWLAAQGETPSPYIAAWFEAVDTATPAPVVDAGIEFALLATRAQLIAAFGVFTGMENSWFKNLKDTPKLKDARKVAGSGGRASTEPLYCPFEVMRWLTDPKRKKGRRLMPDKGWQLLEGHFLKVYNKNSIGDTRTD